jgi:hypothetical protein
MDGVVGGHARSPGHYHRGLAVGHSFQQGDHGVEIASRRPLRTGRRQTPSAPRVYAGPAWHVHLATPGRAVHRAVGQQSATRCTQGIPSATDRRGEARADPKASTRYDVRATARQPRPRQPDDVMRGASLTRPDAGRNARLGRRGTPPMCGVPRRPRSSRVPDAALWTALGHTTWPTSTRWRRYALRHVGEEGPPRSGGSRPRRAPMNRNGSWWSAVRSAPTSQTSWPRHVTRRSGHPRAGRRPLRRGDGRASVGGCRAGGDFGLGR